MKKLSLLLFALLIIAGCSKSGKLDNRVFGEWVEDTTIWQRNPTVLNFNSDGTYTAFYPASYEGARDINDKGTYTTKEMQNPEKWKNGGCVIVLDSDYGNDFEIDFVAYAEPDSCYLIYYKIKTDRNGNATVSDEEYTSSPYFKK